MKKLSTSNRPYGTTTRIAPVRAHATYNTKLPPQLADNILIAGLVPERSQQELVDVLVGKPDLAWLGEHDSTSQRRMALDISRNHFVPIERTVRVSESLHSLRQTGYLQRAGFFDGFHLAAAERRAACTEFLTSGQPKAQCANSAGGSLLGPPGVGKSSTVRRFLASQPQVIVHQLESYRAEFQQLSHLVISCPPNHSTKTLCHASIRAVDAVLGTDYLGESGKLSRDGLVEKLAGIADIHCLGMLVLDHAQNLVSKNGATEDIVRFLTALTDTVGVPIFFVGTPETAGLWESCGSLGRRAAMHSFEWKPLNFDVQWEVYVEHLLDLQVLPERYSYSEEFAALLWEQSQGVIDFANVLFHKLEWVALEKDARCIGVDLLREVACLEMPTIQSELRRARQERQRDVR
jgi:hypothetical protein